MRNTLSLLGLALPLFAACAAAPPAAPLQYRSEYKTTVGLTLGRRSLGNEFDPVQHQDLYGLDFDVRQEGETVGFEMDLLHSDEERTSAVAGVGDVRFRGRTEEISAGARWMFEPWFADVRPYFGLGASSIWVRYDATTTGVGTDGGHAWTPGAYAHAGLWWSFAENFGVGLDYRKEFFTRVHISGVLTDADYDQIAITLGYSF